MEHRTTISANNFCKTGRVSYPAINGCLLSGMESRPAICAIVNDKVIWLSTSIKLI